VEYSVEEAVGSQINCGGESVAMTCRDYERLWNELLDSETCARGSVENAGLPGLGVAECERALLQHAAECAACGQVGARFQLLRRAIRAWGPAPAPSAGLTDRILAEIEAPATTTALTDYRSNQRERHWPALAGLAAIAAAAVVLAIALPTLNRSMERAQRNGPSVTLHNTPFDPKRGSATIIGDRRALNVALAEATAATWDLARSASEPAARISREVLDAATRSDQTPHELTSNTGPGAVRATVSVPSLDSLVPDTAAGAMLQQVGDHFTHGVRPLSDTARHAFGFLLGTTLTKPDVRLNPPAQKGA
jgi:hypothetical protein